MGRKAYLTCDITGREFDIRNGSVAGMQRIDGKVDHAFEPLIRTNIPKQSALHKRTMMHNIQCDNRHQRSPVRDTPARKCGRLFRERYTPALSQIKRRKEYDI